MSIELSLAEPFLAASIIEALGIVALVVITLLLAGVLWVAYHIWKFKRALKQFAPAMKNLGDAFRKGVVPDSLGLTPADDAALLADPKLVAARQEFESAGLRFGGAYTTAKMPGVVLATFADPDRGVTAAVANAGAFGMTCDVVTMYEDGSAITHRTLKSLGLDHPPQFRQVHVPDATRVEVLERHLAEREDKPFRRVQPADVAALMEEFNAEVVRWRDQRGGLTDREVRDNLRIMGNDVDEDGINMVVAASKLEAEKRRNQTGK